MAQLRASLRLALLLNIVLLGCLSWLILQRAHDPNSPILVIGRRKAPPIPDPELPATPAEIKVEDAHVGGSCSMCAVGPELCGRLGEDGMLKALSFGGSGDRIRRLIAKLRQGHTLTVGSLGGSMSWGQTLIHDDPPNSPENLHRIIFDQLNERFPAPNGFTLEDNGRNEDKNTFINGAERAIGTPYYSRCFGLHIPEDVDLVLVEQGINDQVELRSQETYELLVRGLLDLPRKPAILNLNVFQIRPDRMIVGGDLHHGVAEYYDLPVLALRNPLLPKMLSNISLLYEMFPMTSDGKKEGMDNRDKYHFGVTGHRLVAQSAIAYIDHVRCEMEKREKSLGLNPKTLDIDEHYPSPDVPRLLVTEGFHETKQFQKFKPVCYSARSKRAPLVPGEGSSGWRHWNWQTKHYVIADEVGALINFHINTQIGTVILNFLRSAKYGLGSLKCWVDDEEDRSVTVDGYWDEVVSIEQETTVRNDLPPGDHTLHCKILEQTADPGGGHEFRLTALVA